MPSDAQLRVFRQLWLRNASTVEGARAVTMQAMVDREWVVRGSMRVGPAVYPVYALTPLGRRVYEEWLATQFDDLHVDEPAEGSDEYGEG